MPVDAVVLERLERVLVITIDRPDSRNAVDEAVAAGLLGAVELLDADPDLSVGVLTGSGTTFCSGMDLREFVTHGTPPSFIRFLRRGAQKPLVAAIEGAAVAGGLEVALTCDLIVAARGALIGLPEVGVGLFAAGGALSRAATRLPFGVAAELALTADPMIAEDALARGLVNRLAEPGDALEVACQLAARIATRAPVALRATKRVLWDALGRTQTEFWDMQDEILGAVFESSDAEEGSAAFLERRSPRWQNR